METKGSLPCSQQPATCSYPMTDQSSPRPRSFLILPFHLRLFLPSRLFPSGFPTKTLYTHLLSSIRATCPAHLIVLDMMTRIIFGEEYRSWSSLFRSLLHSPVTSSLQDADNFFNTLCSNTLSLSITLLSN